MKKHKLTTAIVIAGAALASNPTPAQGAAHSKHRKVYVLGDSFLARMHDAGFESTFPNSWKVHTSYLVGRAVDRGPSPSGLAQVEQDAKFLRHADAVVIQLGTNPQDGDTAAFVNDMGTLLDDVKSKAPHAQISWVNIGTKDPKVRHAMNSRNRSMRKTCSQRDVYMIDWHHEMSGHSAWFADDPERLHPNADGVKALSDLIRITIERQLDPFSQASSARPSSVTPELG